MLPLDDLQDGVTMVGWNRQGKLGRASTDLVQTWYRLDTPGQQLDRLASLTSANLMSITPNKAPRPGVQRPTNNPEALM